MVFVTSCRATVHEVYLGLIESGRYLPDPHQERAVRRLDALATELQVREHSRGFMRGLLRPLIRRGTEGVRGAYLQGGVGRGKTWMMDLFFETLAIETKRRVHFHRFMQRVHSELVELGNVSDPLPRIVGKWAATCSLLCLDEFFVSDIGDAMVLSGLLAALFEQGVTLVTTSNTAPDDLYKNGLQRARFLPAIDLIKIHTELIRVEGEADHRLRILERSETYHTPLDPQADIVMKEGYERIACGSDGNAEFEINGRGVYAIRRSDGVAWFEFRELCEKPIGSADYIELARAFNTILVSNVPVLDEAASDAARRFITMIDEFYDRNVKVLISAAAPANELYKGSLLAFEFRRTASRLAEMQTHVYLARPHRP